MKEEQVHYTYSMTALCFFYCVLISAKWLQSEIIAPANVMVRESNRINNNAGNWKNVSFMIL